MILRRYLGFRQVSAAGKKARKGDSATPRPPKLLGESGEANGKGSQNTLPAAAKDAAPDRSSASPPRKPRRKRKIIGPPRGMRVKPKVIYVTNPDTQVDFMYGRLVLKTPDSIHKIPALMTRELILGPEINLHPRATRHLLRSCVPVSFLDEKGRCLGLLRGGVHHDVRTRLAQYRLYDNPNAKLELARLLISAKAANSCAVLQRYRKNHPEFECRQTVKDIRKHMSRLTRTSEIEALRGFEGTIARLYFGMFGRMLPEQYAFVHRSRRPPLDAVNALMSYTYTFFCRELAAILEALGLDPYLGYLHEPVSGRPSLALDLMEPLRPALADRFVATALNRGEIQEDDFEAARKEDGAVYLNHQGKNKFFQSLEKWLCNCQRNLGKESYVSPRKILENEVESFKKALLGESLSQWQPHRIPAPGEQEPGKESAPSAQNQESGNPSR